MKIFDVTSFEYKYPAGNNTCRIYKTHDFRNQSLSFGHQVKTNKYPKSIKKNLMNIAMDAAFVAKGSPYAMIRLPLSILGLANNLAGRPGEVWKNKKELAEIFVDVSRDISTQDEMIYCLNGLKNTEEFTRLISIFTNSTCNEVIKAKTKDYKDEAMRLIFPKIKNDYNGARAKISYLQYLVNTGEYADSRYFINAFRELPEESYLWDKLTIVRNIILDENLYNNQFHQTMDTILHKEYREYLLSSYGSEKYGIDLVPKGSIDLKSFKKSKYIRNKVCQVIEEKKVHTIAGIIGSFINENGVPDAVSDELFEYCNLSQFLIAQKLTKENDTITKNKLYDFYSNGFQKLNNEILSIPEQIAALNYMETVMDSEVLQQEFFDNVIDKELFDDMKKDYAIWHDLIEPETEFEECKAFIDERVEEKLNSSNKKIQKSKDGFLYLTGFADKYSGEFLKSLVDSPNALYSTFKLLNVEHLDNYLKNNKQSNEIRERKIINKNLTEIAKNEARDEINKLRMLYA